MTQLSRGQPGTLGSRGRPARSSSARWLAFVERKVTLARRLARGDLDGGYNDGMLLLAARISGMAADAWPGSGLDKGRMTQLLVRWAGQDLAPERISVPLLLEAMRKSQRDAEARAIQGHWPKAFGSGH